MTQQEPRVFAGDYKTVLFEIEGKVATVTLNRPEAMNAFNQAMVDEFRQLWCSVRAEVDPSLGSYQLSRLRLGSS